MICKICGNKEKNNRYFVKEMMFGLREKFSYFECNKCECLQLETIPKNLNKYYPENYYSQNEKFVFGKNFLFKYLRKKRDQYVVYNNNIKGKLLNSIIPNNDPSFKILKQISISPESKILDVGCGNGKYLKILEQIGFKNLIGIDPFLKNEISSNNIKLIKGTIHEIKEKFDLITFHHSFEHLIDPIQTLESTRKKLKNNGFCIIRIPLVSSYSWKNYKENWVQIDAPRHIFLHSKKSMEMISKRNSFMIEKIIFDSSSFQFTGSEKYLMDIPLIGSKPDSFYFSKKKLKYFRRKAQELNLIEKGDSCSFILRKMEDFK